MRGRRGRQVRKLGLLLSSLERNQGTHQRSNSIGMIEWVNFEIDCLAGSNLLMPATGPRSRIARRYTSSAAASFPPTSRPAHVTRSLLAEDESIY